MRHPAALLAACMVLGTASARASALPANALAFRDAPIGTVIPNRAMPTIDGRKEQFFTPSKANVFVFFRVRQDHSVEALRQMARLEAEMKGRSVRFIGIVSSSDPIELVLEVIRDTGIRMPVVIDKDDALYGELGVYLHPSLGIVDERGKLVGYQPFRKINMLDATRGRIQLVLGEIDDAKLASIIDPPPTPTATKSRAHARVTLAKALLQAGKVDEAVVSLRAALVIDANYAEAHATLSEALAKQGSCSEAESEHAVAVKLAPAAPPAAPLACAKR